MPHSRLLQLKKLSGRQSLLAAELTDDEVALVKNSKVETFEPYELDDLDENGQYTEKKIPSRFAP